MSKRIWLIVFLLSLLGGPGYFAYVKYRGGERIGIYPIGLGNPASSIGGRESPAFKPIPMALAPEMNPVRVIMHWTYDTLTIPQALQNHYVAALLRNGQTVAKNEFQVSTPSGDKTPATSSSAAILDANVSEPVEYVFTLVERARSTIELRNVEIEFRRNARDAPLWTLVGGIGLAIIAALFMARTPKGEREARRTRLRRAQE